jgi:glycosyltransferase involved in cell wall biosynthesis
MEVLFLTPEPPYPLHGGGAYRIASLIHYFSRFAQVDMVLISDSGKPAEVPAGLVRSQHVIPLPLHSRSTAARYLRNARRALRGVPPLIDRVAGLEGPIAQALAGRHYDVGVVEHFWCAPYLDLLNKYCRETVLDLHNVESVLHDRCAMVSYGMGSLTAAGHRRFGAASRKLESALIPRYSRVLAASEEDARSVRAIAPGAKAEVYPNAIPWVELPRVAEQPCVVFSGNFEYHPNIDAVGFLIGEIWPGVRKARPDIRLRLVGRGDAFIRHLLPRGGPEETGIEVTGPVEDARAEIARAQVVVAPVRAGSGTRIKILEAWAAARAVVSTPLGAEGLAGQDGANIALEGTAQGFADRIVSLLSDAPARQLLGASGHRTFEDNYTWEAAWNTLDFEAQSTRAPGLSGYTGNF